MESDLEKARARFMEDLDSFLVERFGSDDYAPWIKPGLAVGWVLLADRMLLEDAGDPADEGYYSIISKPGQRGTTTIGMVEQSRARMLGAYIGQGIDVGRDDTEGD